MRRGNNADYLNKHFNRITVVKKKLETLKRLELAKYSFQIVVHCAANAYVGESETKPEMYLNQNILATSQLLNALDLKVLKRFQLIKLKQEI